MEWQSTFVRKSQAQPGVEFVFSKMTFGRRIELMRTIRDLASKLEFFQAGRDEKQQIEASLLGAEIDRIYVLWGLREVRGLDIDGHFPDTEMFIDRGPEELVTEALSIIRYECGLGQQERKN